jgi:hypothetical protein
MSETDRGAGALGPEGRCRDCRFFCSIRLNENKVPEGHCRRRAPILDAAFLHGWPIVRAYQGCGEWEFSGPEKAVCDRCEHPFCYHGSDECHHLAAGGSCRCRGFVPHRDWEPDWNGITCASCGAHVQTGGDVFGWIVMNGRDYCLDCRKRMGE